MTLETLALPMSSASDLPHPVPRPWSVHELVEGLTATPLTPDRGGYTITMREEAGAREALRTLAAEQGASPSRLHVGWGSFRNLDVVAARRSAHVLLMDLNAHQLAVWAAVDTALRQPHVTDVTSFIDEVVQGLPTTPRLRQFMDCTHAWITADTLREGSWLWTQAPERFAWVQGLFRSGRVAVACMDMRGGPGPSQFAGLRARLSAAREHHGIQADTLYVSNLLWMMAQAKGFFGEAHDDHMASHAGSALMQAQGNLASIAPVFQWVVEASHLAPAATDANLQWQTRLHRPADFVGSWA